MRTNTILLLALVLSIALLATWPSAYRAMPTPQEAAASGPPAPPVSRQTGFIPPPLDLSHVKVDRLPDGVMAYGRPDLTPDERVQVDFHLKANDPPRSYLAPGAQIDYFWEVEEGAGNKLTTEPATFVYEDIRFSWESVSEGNVSVYWYAGSRSSAESSLGVARETLDEMSALLGATVDYPVKVWIYDSYQDMLPALVRRSEAHA